MMRPVIVLACALLLAGCAVAGGGTPGPSLIAVPTQSPPPTEGTPGPCPAALTEGELVANDEWGIALKDSSTGDTIQVLWPFGFAARDDTDGRALLNEAGEVVAHEGDLVRIDGGEFGAHAWRNCGSITVLSGS
jgi:hypothetical protein